MILSNDNTKSLAQQSETVLPHRRVQSGRSNIKTNLIFHTMNMNMNKMNMLTQLYNIQRIYSVVHCSFITFVLLGFLVS